MRIESLKEQARRHEQKEEWRQALEQYKKAMVLLEQEDQPDIGLYNRVGDLLVRVANRDEAVDNYEKAVDLYVAEGLHNNAIAVCKKIVRSAPHRHQVYLRMGRIRAHQGFIPDARENFLRYAERMQRSGDLDESFRALVELCDLAPDETGFRLAVADQMVSHQRVDEAIGQLSVAYAALLEKGDEEKAAEVATRAREVDPEVDLTGIAAVVEGAAGVATEDAFELGAVFEEAAHEEPALPLEGLVPPPLPQEPPPPLEGLEATHLAQEPPPPLEGLEATHLAQEPPPPLEGLEATHLAQEPPPVVPEASPPSLAAPHSAPETEDDDAKREAIPEVPSYLEGLPVLEMPDEVGEAAGSFLDAPEGPEEAPVGSGGDSAQDPVGEADVGPVDEPTTWWGAGPAEDIAGLRERIAANPADIGLRQRLVELAYQAGDVHQLIEAYMGLAAALTRSGDDLRALAAYQEVLRLDENHLEALLALRDHEAATAPAAVSEVASHEDYVDLGALVLAEEETKTTRFVVPYEEPSGDEEADFARMLTQFKQKVAQNLDASDVRAHYDLGTAYKEMGLLDEAVAEFQQALRGSASHLPTYEMLGQTFIEMENPAAAVRSLERALEVDNAVEAEFLGIYYYLGRAYEEVGNKGQAVEFYDRVFSLDINFADVTERLRALR